MDKQIFRKEAVDRISSPEQMNDYIKVAKPGVWVLLTAIVVFLIGVVAWGKFGNLESTTQAVVVSDGNQAVLYVNETAVTALTSDMTVKINDTEYPLETIATQAVKASDLIDEVALHAGNMSDSDWAYYATIDGDIESGTYEVKLVTEKVNPISFIIN